MIDRLVLTTGKDPVPEKKLSVIRTRECVINQPSEDQPDTPNLSPSYPPRVRECPVQMEGMVHEYRSFGKNVSANAFEVHIVKLHVEESLLVGDKHIDPVRWRPLIMSFCRFFGVGGEVHPSRLAESGFMKFVRQGTGARQSPASAATD
jgi:hypothetical protein